MALRTMTSKTLTLVISMMVVASCIVVQLPTAKAQVTQIIWNTDKTLTTEFIVQPDEELIIRAGVTVEVSPNTNLTIYGNLTIQGTHDDEVVFTENHALPGFWGMVNIFDAVRPSYISNCLMYNPEYGLNIINSEVHIDHSNISYAYYDGIHATNSYIDISNSTFYRNGLGMTMIQAGIYLVNSRGTIDNNYLAENNHGVYLKEASTANITNNLITGASCFQCSGIKVRTGSSPFISRNDINNNYAGIISNNSDPTILNNTIWHNLDDGLLLVNIDASKVKENDISYNGDDGIEANSGALATLTGNMIHHNTEAGLEVANATPKFDHNRLYSNWDGVWLLDRAHLISNNNTIEANSQNGLIVMEHSNLTSDTDKVHGNGDTGILLSNSSTLLRSPALISNRWNLRALDRSEAFIVDGYSQGALQGELEINNSNVTTLNFTRVNQTVKWDGYWSVLIIEWYLTVRVIDKRGLPFPGVSVNITPTGRPSIIRDTDARGIVERLILMESRHTYNSGSTTGQHWNPYDITVTFGGYSNDTDLTLNQSKDVILMLEIPNNPPVLTAPFITYFFNEDTTALGLVNCSEHFSDEGTLIYSLIYEEDPTKVDGRVNGDKLDFYTPTKDWYGIKTFRVRAMDPEGLITDGNTFNVSVLPVNDPPTLSPLSNITALINEEKSTKLYGNDVDNSPGELVYKSLSVPPAGVTLTLDPHSGVITFKSIIEGQFTFWFFVIDPLLAGSGNVTLNVTVSAMNIAPGFISTPGKDAYIDTDYKYLVEWVDPENDPVNLTLVSGPEGMGLNNHQLEWTPNTTQKGQHMVTISITDGLHPAVYQVFNITVHPKNRPPAVKITSHSNGGKYNNSQPFAFQGTASDPDGNTLSFTWKIDGTVQSTALSFNTPLSIGTHTISLAASDGIVTAYDNITIVVVSQTTPPVIHYDTYSDSLCLWLLLAVGIVSLVTVLSYRKMRP